MFVEKNDKIIFMGDSITDDGRMGDPEGLGESYVRLIRDLFELKYPDYRASFINHGISGDRVLELRARWERDVINQDPDIVCISIGINDVWRQLDRPEDSVFIDEFERVYREILESTKKNTKARIMLMETSVIGEEKDSEGNNLLIPYNECIHRLAKEYGALLVPICQACMNYIENVGFLDLTVDGVHLSSLGKALFATTWIEAIENGE